MSRRYKPNNRRPVKAEDLKPYSDAGNLLDYRLDCGVRLGDATREQVLVQAEIERRRADVNRKPAEALWRLGHVAR